MARRIIMGTGLAMLLAGCQAPGRSGWPSWTPAFQLAPATQGQATTSSRGGSAGSVTITPSAAGPTDARRDGTLTVRFDHVLNAASSAKRRLLATLADVDRLTITLSGPGVTHTETIAKAQLAGGMTSFTFNGLPPVALTVTIQALSATGTVLGQDVQHTTVVAGSTTVVTSTVLLAPTVASPRIITPGGASGGGSSSGGAVGGLTTTVTIVDGTAATVKIPPIDAIYFAGLDGIDVGDFDLHADGSVWAATGPNWGAIPLSKVGGHLVRVDGTGTTASIAVPANDQAALFTGASNTDLGFVNASAPDGHVRVRSSGMDGLGLSFDAGGQFVASETFDADTALAFDPAGHAWGLYYSGITTFYSFPTFFTLAPAFAWGPTGPILAPSPTYGVPDLGEAVDLRIDHAGRFWISSGVTSPNGGTNVAWDMQLINLNPDLTVRQTIVVPSESATDMGLDSLDNLWFAKPGERRIQKISPDGQPLATATAATRFNRLFVDANNGLWAYQGLKTDPDSFAHSLDTPSDQDLVARFALDGTLLAYYHLGQGVDLTKLMVTADGTMWAATGSKGLIKLHVDMPFQP